MSGFDVVIPIFNAAAALRRCLDSLHVHLPETAAVILVDDASTDPAVADLIDGFAAHCPVPCRVLRQPCNRGFVSSANLGMQASTRDVVLLNSDTVVTHGWLERLAACLASDPRIATATPWSNNAEICSLPEFCRANPEPDDPERLARAAVDAGPPCYPELPTAVGFCMAIRRAALAKLGDFDEATFGRGYGEENDFCMRAAGHGWRNVLCDDAYVVHQGGASFAATGDRPGGAAMDRVLARYPDYNDRVSAFIAEDPLRPHRERVLARLVADTP
ncbi:MAG TPA: glycosyltransferase family 2 protein [Xanthomonadaceae bacterium]|nr:glycosyltransferase family 2 protein [Xanthomonadaceae bacterium]